MLKCYIDIGCTYCGDESAEYMYKDITNWDIKNCGIINILKLDIDKEKRTKKEILFRQILNPMNYKFKCSVSDYKIYTSCILKEFDNADLFITFNGRDFDIPIIINNLNLSDRQKEYYIKYFTDRDRDLLDWCVLKKINIKGGLRKTCERLNIYYDINPIDKQKICILSFGQYANRYNNYLALRKQRNEHDIKILPLLEEKLGLLYEPRLYADKYHKKW